VEEEAPDENDSCNIQITKIEVFVAPIKVKKVNIGTNNNSKMESIRDYWDEQIV
jgi:hypothetical protein